MDVYLISEDGVEAHAAGELSELLDKPDALIWVDIPLCIGQDAGCSRRYSGSMRSR